jgi:hypothetical protein
MGVSALARWLLLGVLAILACDATAQRRGVRVDTGAWFAPIDIPSASCPLATAGSTLVTWRGHVFSGRDVPAHLFDPYCQYTEPTQFSGFGVFFDDSEDVLAQMVGSNFDDRVSAIRYAMLDGVPFNNATGFQWVFVLFPFDGAIVGLYGFDDPPIALDTRSYISRGGTKLWDGGRDGYEGEFFCFEGGTYRGRWNGANSPASPCLTIGFRLFKAGFE